MYVCMYVYIYIYRYVSCFTFLFPTPASHRFTPMLDSLECARDIRRISGGFLNRGWLFPNLVREFLNRQPGFLNHAPMCF